VKLVLLLVGAAALRFRSVNLGSQSVAKDYDDDIVNSLKVDTVEWSVAAVSASHETHLSEGDRGTRRQIDGSWMGWVPTSVCSQMWSRPGDVRRGSRVPFVHILFAATDVLAPRRRHRRRTTSIGS